MKKCLVIDDSSLIRKFHMKILESSGFRADGASDGMEAMEKALSNKYDVILCDLNMPNMDGVVFIKKFREINNDIPVIIISTQEEINSKNEDYISGANIYIVKPVKPDDLILNINLAIGNS